MSYSDFSREQVEAQQKAIEAEEVLSQPLIGDELPIEVLLVEFENSPHYLEKLQVKICRFRFGLLLDSIQGFCQV
jgi:hypothetical protein